ncbi:MAG: hypothetical protein HDR12_11920 [Lachnospiraceae bacterium]|nr:hypothetical protein [Lachnospiraceae bacterium]
MKNITLRIGDSMNSRNKIMKSNVKIIKYTIILTLALALTLILYGCGSTETAQKYSDIPILELTELDNNVESDGFYTASFGEAVIEVRSSDEEGNIKLEIPIEYDTTNQVYISMIDETHGSILYCSSPAMGQMYKILYRTDDGWDSYEEIDISSQLDSYPNSLTMSSEDTGYIGVALRNSSYLYHTQDGGQTWEPYVVDESVDNCNGFAPVFEREGKNAYLILDMKINSSEYRFRLYQSANDGKEWDIIGEFSLPAYLSRYFLKDDVLYVVDAQDKCFSIDLK